MKKIVIVSGANGQLGRAVVHKFIHNGYKVIGLIRKKSSEKTVSNLEEIEIDLKDENHCIEVVDAIISKYGRIDAAVLTAGGFAMGDLVSTKMSDVNSQVGLNFETSYNIARPVMQQMLKQEKGRLFLIGSKAGLDVSKAKSTIAYALAKSLLFRLAELFNGMVKGKNVVTTVVVPSIIDTPQNRSDMPDADYSHWVTPEQIAQTILHYCSDEADAIREPVIKIYNRS